MEKENLDMRCPVCGGELSRLWPTVNSRGKIRFFLFSCPACNIQWRIKNSAAVSPAPVCPVCQRHGREMVRMSPKDIGRDGVTRTWVCWEDGTLLHNIGGRPVIESFGQVGNVSVETARPNMACG